MINTLSSKASFARKLLANYAFFYANNNLSQLLHKQISHFSQNSKDRRSNVEESSHNNKSQGFSKPSNQYSRQVVTRQDKFDNQRNQVPVRRSEPKQTRQIREFFYLDEQSKLNAIQMYKNKQKIRELSMIAKQLLFETDKLKSQVIWCSLQQAFVSLLHPTQDQNRIRSLSKFLYSLGKSKRATRNYQTHMALLLPFSSHQSFTEIVTTISRMGGMSEEFSHIVEKLYWKRKEEFNPLEMNLVNYVLAKNGKKIDAQLIEKTEHFPLRSIVLMLRAYNMAEMMTPSILKMCIPAIVSRKRQTNFLDFRGVFNVYCKYLFLDDKKLIEFLQEQYRILARNVNEQALQQIWQHFPKAVNANKLPIALVQQIIKSLKILRTRNRMSERTWKKIALSFSDFQNLQIRTQLEKI